ncbi:MAG: GNAT family N-acetyltransferase [Haloarculaceae archaeon]
MDVRVRPLREEEEEVERLVDELWLPFADEMAEVDGYNELVDETTAREHGLAYRREQLDDADARVWVAEREGAWVGYVRASVSTPAPVFARGPTLQVGELYVVPGARGAGVADALLDRAAEWGRTRDCERVGLSVNANNDRARSFYDRRGFEARRLKLDRPL